MPSQMTNIMFIVSSVPIDTQSLFRNVSQYFPRVGRRKNRVTRSDYDCGEGCNLNTVLLVLLEDI